MKEIEVMEYFHGEEYVEKDLLESLLLSIMFDEDNRELHVVLVVCRTNDFYSYLQTGQTSKDKKRQFVHFVFTKISSLSVIGKAFSFDGEFIFAPGSKYGLLLQDYKTKKENIWHITLKFSSGNECSFDFESILFEQRLGRAEKQVEVDDWNYFDAATGSQLNFYNPFNLN